MVICTWFIVENRPKTSYERKDFDRWCFSTHNQMVEIGTSDQSNNIYAKNMKKKMDYDNHYHDIAIPFGEFNPGASVPDMASASPPDPNGILGAGIRDLLECSVCFEPYTTPKLLSCGHTFCADPCLTNLLDQQTNRNKLICPLCRYSN